MVGTQIMLILALGGWPRRRSEMSDLHEAHDPGREPQIDTAGWVYSAVAVAIIASAVIVAYRPTMASLRMLLRCRRSWRVSYCIVATSPAAWRYSPRSAAPCRGAGCLLGHTANRRTAPE